MANPSIEIRAPVVEDQLKGVLRRYRNINTGTWLFGLLQSHWSPDGLEEIWITDERQALADNGELATMLGLGSGESTSASMVSPHGTRGASATRWDSVLEQVAGGTHASEMMCRRSQKRRGGVFDAIRSDGARLERQESF